MSKSAKNISVELRLSAQRALLGNIPPTLRVVSLEVRRTVIHFRAVFTSAATNEHRESLSVAATEVIADFSEPFYHRGGIHHAGSTGACWEPWAPGVSAGRVTISLLRSQGI